MLMLILNKKESMSDQNQANPTTDAQAPAPVSNAGTLADTPVPTDEITGQGAVGAMENVSDKIKEVHNILIALSSDPSVDDIAAAIGLSLYLDRMGKRATAIYSGRTPNALEFLNPQNTFETNSDVLRDFVVALSKDKADHLRYKLDGDYVKIFITPYKSVIDEEDLEFSYGDFNIELVLALNVASGIDLDDALREHGRVMHDAVVINITKGNPGKFGDIEWSDKTKSSVSEMCADLIFSLDKDGVIGSEEATALLTGIVAATEHFSNNSTTADSLEMAARLIDSHANRELVSENIGLDVQNMFFNNPVKEPNADSEEEEADTKSKLEIEHEDDKNDEEESEKDSGETKKSEVTLTLKEEKPEEELEKEPKKGPKEETKEEKEPKKEPKESSDDGAPKDSVLLADLQAAAESLSKAGAEVTPEAEDGPVRIGDEASPSGESKPAEEPATTVMPPITAADVSPIAPDVSTEPADSTDAEVPETKQEKTIAPSFDFTSETSSNKYGKMLEEALAEANAAATPVTPLAAPDSISSPSATIDPISNPAMSMAPPVASAPEINGVPEINYAPAGGDLLPPPPTPPVDFSSPAPMGAMPDFSATPSSPAPTSGPALENNPVVIAPEAKPGSYQIPTNP